MFKTGMTLHPERVWKEFSRALEEPYWELFIEWLIRVGNVIPELDWVPYTRDVSNFNALEYRLVHVCTEIPLNVVETFLSRIGAPSDYRNLALTISKYRCVLMENPSERTPEEIYEVYTSLHKCNLLGDYFIWDTCHDDHWFYLLEGIQWDKHRKSLVNSMAPGKELGQAILNANLELIKDFFK
tara:strand:+ start:208 stop:759 length:552 start_codon:yes stop_codon:yes gene_type:complete